MDDVCEVGGVGGFVWEEIHGYETKEKKMPMNRRDMQNAIADPFEGQVIDAEEVVARSEAMLSTMRPSGGRERKEESPRYKKLQTVLGEGTFKKVYKAIDQEEGREVAWNEVKMGERGSDGSERASFANEIALLKSISHPNILRIFDYWFTCDSFVFITELMTGGTLRQYISSIGDLNVRLIKRWGRQILEGLVYLHSQEPPIIHRDIKCENIFVNATLGEVKIGDLGVAKERRMKRYTVVGTPQFMAREMFEGDGYCEKIDVYAFGMCLIEMATGMYPYKECVSAADVYKAIIQGVPPVVLNSIKDVCLRNLIMNCLVSSRDRLRSVDCVKHHFFDNDNGCGGECIPAECMTVVPLTAPANDMEISLLSFSGSVITFQLFFMSMARFIKFDYDLESDTVEEVANEMLEEEVVCCDQREALLGLLSKGIEKAKQSKMGGVYGDERRSSLSPANGEGTHRDVEGVGDRIERGREEKKTSTEGAGVKNDFNQIASRGAGMEDTESTQEVEVRNGLRLVSLSPLQSPVACNKSETRTCVGSPGNKGRGGTSGAELSPSMCGGEVGTSEEQRRQSDRRCFEDLECPSKKYDNDVSIEEFSSDVSVITKRSAETASNWIKTFKLHEIDTVFELKILVDEDWDKLGLPVFSSRAMKNVLYGIDKIPLKEKQLATNTQIRDYEESMEIKVFLEEIGTMVGKGKCVSVWENKLLAQDIRTVGELRSLHQDDWDRLGLSVYSCRILKNVIFKKGKLVFG